MNRGRAPPGAPPTAITFVFGSTGCHCPEPTDKATGESSFARSLIHLRARVHRGPPVTLVIRVDSMGVQGSRSTLQ